MKQQLINNFKKTIFWVDPIKLKLFSPPPNWWWYARLEKRIKNERILDLLKKFAMDKLHYGGNWDLFATSFYESDWVKNINSLRLNLDDYKSSNWYQFIKSQIYTKGFYKHKQTLIKNEKELDYLFEKQFIEVIHSVKKRGFIIENKNSLDVPKVLMSRDGNLIKTGNGCHRLAIIQEFAINCSFPIQIIGIHKKHKINGISSSILNLNDVKSYIFDNYCR